MSPTYKKLIGKETKPKRTRAPRESAAPRETALAPSVRSPVLALPSVAPVEPKRNFLFAIGRRKTASAIVRVFKNGTGIIMINKKPLLNYFAVREQHEAVRSPLVGCGQASRLDVNAVVRGGGLRGQSEAVRLGIARALLLLNPTFRKNLRKSGYLTRDPRAKERKKYGLKKARRAPQWQKR